MPTGPRLLRIFVSTDLSKRPYVSYYTPDGKKVRTSKGLNTEKTYEGRLAAAEALAEEIRSTYVPHKAIEERAWDWIESRKPYLRTKSYYGYQSKLRVFLSWKGNRKMSKELVTEYFAYRASRVAGGTLKDDQIYLNRVFSSITEERYFDHLNLPKFSAVTRRRYQPRQIARIKAYLTEEDPMLWFACQCVYYLFIRPGSELRLLQAHHFNLDEWQVNIPPHISKNGKNDYVVIPEPFRQEVEDYVGDMLPSEFVFPAVFESGKPIGKNTMMNRYRRHMDALGFGFQYSMYGWKNTGAIACVNKGIHPKHLQLQLRHSSLEMTDRYLRRMGVKDMGDLADRFPSL